MAEFSSLPPPAPKKSNKIRDIVRLQQMLKKWKKTATSKNNNNNNNNSSSSSSSSSSNSNSNSNSNNSVTPATTIINKTTTTKGLNKFLKKTLSFSDISTQGQEDVVKKGYLAVWVGRDEDAMKKFVIPTDYLTHQAFSLLLHDAEEEFGFQQEGILKIPCDVPFFESILKSMSENKKSSNQQQQQRPFLRSSSSTSSFFLYDDQEKTSNSSATPPPRRRSSNFDAQLIKTPPTTPTHNLPLYCR